MNDNISKLSSEGQRHSGDFTSTSIGNPRKQSFDPGSLKGYLKDGDDQSRLSTSVMPYGVKLSSIDQTSNLTKMNPIMLQRTSKLKGELSSFCPLNKRGFINNPGCPSNF